VTKAEDGIDLVVGQRPVGGGNRAQHVREQVNLVERDGIMETIVEVVSHRSTSVAIAGPARDVCQGTSRTSALA
jgi:hypothetical protein